MAKTKCTTDQIELIASLVEQGSSLSNAAYQNNLSPQTVANWYNWGSQSQTGVYKLFYDSVLEARESHKQGLLDHLEQIAMEGLKQKKIQTVTAPDGSVTQRKEVSNQDEIKAIFYLLDNRYGFDQNFRRGINKAANRIMSIVRNSVDRDSYEAILNQVVEDNELGEAELTVDLF